MAVLGTEDAERLDLSLVWDPAWTTCVRVANPKRDEAVSEDPGLALDPHDGSIAVIDGEVITQARRERSEHPLTRAHEGCGNLELGQIAYRSGVFHLSRLASKSTLGHRTDLDGLDEATITNSILQLVRMRKNVETSDCRRDSEGVGAESRVGAPLAKGWAPSW